MPVMANPKPRQDTTDERRRLTQPPIPRISSVVGDDRQILDLFVGADGVDQGLGDAA
jgi:hypothetical protein